MRRLAPGMRFSNAYRTVPESRIVDMILLAGWAYEQNKTLALAQTNRALNGWIEMGLGVQLSPKGERLFDPVEVLNVLKCLGLAGRDPFWADRYVRTGRNLVTDLAGESSQDFIVEFKRTFNLRSVPKGKALRLRAPLPLSSIYGDRLDILPFLEGGSDPRLSIGDGRLEARLIAGGDDVILGAKLKFAHGRKSQTEISPTERTTYLKPREGLIVVSEAVSTLAASLAGPGTPTASSVRAFWTYMMDELTSGAVHYDQIRTDAPCDTVLETGWYDCQLGSALFIALCRARGIPARLVGGHVLYRHAPTNHYWAEVWLEGEGWRPFDFLSWDLSLGGSDLSWRDHFYGKIDNRMITQLLPFEFTGSLGVTMPGAWHIVQIAEGRGVLISLAAVSGQPIYSDFVSISDPVIDAGGGSRPGSVN